MASGDEILQSYHPMNIEKKKSRRQELSDFVCSGNLRGLLEMSSTGLSKEAIDLLVDITLRYCVPKK